MLPQEKLDALLMLYFISVIYTHPHCEVVGWWIARKQAIYRWILSVGMLLQQIFCLKMTFYILFLCKPDIENDMTDSTFKLCCMLTSSIGNMSVTSLS